MLKALLVLLFMATCPVANAQKLQTVKGSAWLMHAYCGGANPGQERMERKQPHVKGIFYIIAGNRNTLKAKRHKVVCDDSGRFEIRLPSRGWYCIIDQHKGKALKIPPNDRVTEYKPDCMKKEWEKCEHQFALAANMPVEISVVFLQALHVV